MKFAGKVAIVTGAAKAGWNVAFTYVARQDQAESLIDELSEHAPNIVVRAYSLDVRDADAVDAVADEVISEFGSVQAVVPNAGVSVNGLAFSLSNEDWQ